MPVECVELQYMPMSALKHCRQQDAGCNISASFGPVGGKVTHCAGILLILHSASWHKLALSNLQYPKVLAQLTLPHHPMLPCSFHVRVPEFCDAPGVQSLTNLAMNVPTLLPSPSNIGLILRDDNIEI
jgi:hypothetical protein